MKDWKTWWKSDQNWEWKPVNKHSTNIFTLVVFCYFKVYLNFNFINCNKTKEESTKLAVTTLINNTSKKPNGESPQTFSIQHKAKKF